MLPDGDLTNSSLDYVRNFIDENAKIIAIVSLPNDTFTHSGAGVKASVMFLQKVSKEKLKSIKKKDYKIFTAVIEKIGYDIRGRTVFKKDSHGNILKKEVDIVNYDGTVQNKLYQ